MIDLSQFDVSSPVSYLVAVIVPALDAVLPVLPSETAVVALGVATAGRADPRIAVLITLAACGAFIGDNLAYLVGRRFGPSVERRFFGGERGASRRAWARRALDRYGFRIIILCRFVPGGRTAVTLTCGIIGYRRRNFVVATACAAAIWAAYAFLIGRLGGKAFVDRPWAGFLLALGVALMVSALVELLRRTRPWRVLSRIRSRRSAKSPGPGSGPRSEPGRAAGSSAPGSVPAASPHKGTPTGVGPVTGGSGRPAAATVCQASAIKPGQRDADLGAFSVGTAHPHAPVVGADELGDHGEADAAAGHTGRLTAAPEPVEDVR